MAPYDLRLGLSPLKTLCILRNSVNSHYAAAKGSFRIRAGVKNGAAVKNHPPNTVQKIGNFVIV